MSDSARQFEEVMKTLASIIEEIESINAQLVKDKESFLKQIKESQCK